MRNLGTQHNLRRFRIKPPVEFRVVQIGVAGNEHLSGHGYDLLDQGNDGRVFADREREVSRRCNLENSYFVRIAMDSFNDEVYRILMGRFCVLRKPVGRWNQVIGTRLWACVRAHIINGWTKQELFVKVRLEVMQQWILRADVDLDAPFKSQAFYRFEALSDFLISPRIS